MEGVLCDVVKRAGVDRVCALGVVGDGPVASTEEEEEAGEEVFVAAGPPLVECEGVLRVRREVTGQGGLFERLVWVSVVDTLAAGVSVFSPSPPPPPPLLLTVVGLSMQSSSWLESRCCCCCRWCWSRRALSTTCSVTAAINWRCSSISLSAKKKKHKGVHMAQVSNWINTSYFGHQ